ncbi:MAG TPA: hypothetical protein VFQ65_19790 [Kofleriaceae bacterium]|nr:hypothetical protein [Kofleriaceae bacterium]
MPFLRRYGWLCAIAAAYLYLFPYYPKLQSANELPRVYLVKAMVEDHTFAIDRGVATWGGTSDLSQYAGHYYQNKAPGASLVVAPVYALVRLAGEPSLAATMWLCRIVTGVIPSLWLLWLLYGYLARFAPEPATRKLVLIAYAFGSMAFTYALQFYAHQLSAVCIAAAWIFADGVAARERTPRTMLAVGFLAALAPVVDYQTAFAVLPLAGYVVARMWAWPRGEIVRAFGLAAVGAVVPIAVLLYYHAACFGSPFATGYNYAVTYAADHTHGLLGMTYPKWDAIVGSTVAPSNGMFALAPWWLLAIPGGVYLWAGGERALVITVAGLTLIFFYFVTSLTAWHAGWEVGPRYIVALQPFLLPLVAATFARWRDDWRRVAAASGLVLIGVVIYTVSTATLPTWPDSFANPLYEVAFRLLGDHAVAPNVLSVLGLGSAVLLFAGIAALVGVAIVRAGAGARGLAVAAVICVAGIAAFALAQPGAAQQQATRAAYARTLFPAVAR